MKERTIMLLLSVSLSVTCLAQVSDKNSEFFAAINNGDTIQVTSIIAQYPSYVDLKNLAGEPALVNAIRTKKYGIAKLLIEKGAEINSQSRNQQTPLHMATYNGNYEISKLLLDKGATPDAVNSRGRKPIEFAAGNKGIELLKLFTDIGQKIETVYPDGTTLLHWASSSEDTALVSYLINKGLNIHAVDSDNATVMHWAAATNDTVMIAYLVKKGVDILTPANGGWLPIQTSLRYNSMISFNYLFNHGMDINAKYQRGNSLLHIVAETGNIDAIKLLIAKGVDVNIKNDFQETPLAMASMDNKVDAMKYLIEHGAEINPKQITDNKGVCNTSYSTPLHVSAFRSYDGTKLLIEKGANVNIRNNEGQTPLHNAIWGDSLNIVNYLLDNGANPNLANNEGSTALHLEAGNGNINIVQALLKKGANPNALNSNQQTPLHIAAIKGYSDVINLLIESRAKANLKDKSGRLPIDYASIYGNTASVNVLKKTSDYSSNVKSTKNLLAEKLDKKEAIVYYLNHSGWAIKTQNHFLILDYFIQARQPDNLSVVNGWIDPAELMNQNVTVFSSHSHSDHFDPIIWQWGNSLANINYILGFPTFEAASNRMFIEPRVTREVNGIKIIPINSTDSGEGFLIEVDGVTIYHPGDHASTTRDISDNYKSEIEFLAGLGKPIDLMFLPVTGCSFPDVEAVKLGGLYAIGKLKPKAVFPMHGNTASYSEFAARVIGEYEDQNVEVAENRGDRFTFRDGKTVKIN